MNTAWRANPLIYTKPEPLPSSSWWANPNLSRAEFQAEAEKRKRSDGPEPLYRSGRNRKLAARDDD